MTKSAEPNNQGKTGPTRFAWLKTLLIITFPAWGTVIFVALLGLLPSSADVGVLPLLAALVAPLVGVVPIMSNSDVPLFLKIFIVLPAYYLLSLSVIFAVGWGALCVFQSSCH